MRLLFAILSPVFFLLCVVAIQSEETRPWNRFQQEFAQMLAERARAKLQEAQEKNDSQQAARWQRALDEASDWRPEVKQIYVEDAKIADRCVTCHLGIDNPLFADASQPFRSHPGEHLQTHEVNRFGCTPCHDGQGVATATKAAHGYEENWLRPMLPTRLSQASCGRCHEVVHGLKGAETAVRGADLFLTRGCYGCHDVKGMRYLPKFAPPLNNLATKLVDPQRWVAAWTKNPTALSKETLMPNFHLSDDEAADIAAFLLSVGDRKPLPETQLARASAEEGKKLFTERGCRGCHAVEPDERSVAPGVPHLGEIGSKATTAWLDRWIANPKELFPDAAMPKVELSDAERQAIVAYLLTLKRAQPLPVPPSGGNAEKGEQLVKNYECYGCHAIPGFEQARPSVPDLTEFARKPIDEIDFGNVRDIPRTKWEWLRRKLKEPRAFETEKIKLKMPTMPLGDDEIDALITFVLALDKPPLPSRYTVSVTPPMATLREASWMMARLHCNGCHPVDGQEPRIGRFFERKSRVAPTLDGVGARLQGQYLYQFLLEPKQVRPWLTMRMPVFGFSQEQARTLTEGLAAKANVTNPYTYVAKADSNPASYERGFLRFRHYKCVQCHPSSLEQGLPADIDPDDLSINLMLAKERLRPEWLAEFLARPKQIAGVQTRMPTVFYTVDGVPKVERPEDDIRDIVTYLMGMKEAPEVTLQAFEQKEKAEREKEQIDWTTYQY